MATKKDMELGKKIVDQTARKVLLRMLKYGGDEKNFKILESLPTTSKGLQKILGLTEMPTNNRLRQLKDAGLIKREDLLLSKGKSYFQTELGTAFMKIVNKMQADIIKEMAKMVQSEDEI